MSALPKIILTPSTAAQGWVDVFPAQGSAVARAAANDVFIGAEGFAAEASAARFIPYVGLAIGVGIAAYELYQLYQAFSAAWTKPTNGWNVVQCAGGDGYTPFAGANSASVICGTYQVFAPAPGFAQDQSIFPYYYVWGTKPNPTMPSIQWYFKTEIYSRVVGATVFAPRPGLSYSPGGVSAIGSMPNPNIDPRFLPDPFSDPVNDPQTQPQKNPQTVPDRFPEGDPIPLPTERPVPGLEPSGEPGVIGGQEQVFNPDGSIDRGTSPNSWPKPSPESNPDPSKSKERKVRSKGAMLFGILDTVSEASEVVNSFYDALPDDVRKKWDKIGKERRKGVKGLADQAGQYGISNADWQLEALYHNWDKVDLIEALGNVAYNEVEDKVIGKANKLLGPAGKQARPLTSQALKEYGKDARAWREQFKDYVLATRW